jgi:hypothetical protein
MRLKRQVGVEKIEELRREKLHGAQGFIIAVRCGAMLLSGQRALPRLPVPILEHTLAKLLRTLEPLCSAEEVRRIAESAR